ncbi:SDR family oxidoreductase [Psychromonas sp. Urea-02u-13]|uniref:SDR family oxidoreductase n=1 Tax=Psychromonas sp. Urea-02u-13 TaxID=2058326 RepID=UPI000C32066B|nr:SDR family oxidoreductase [Psychromonas sp. Urea-02u-13]PKG38527.1 short chain dehydrogenase [Psychromonas sp. Urea-02u-13]
MQLQQKTILLTGATGGIGSAMAKALAQAGCYLVLIGRDQSKLEQLKGSLNNACKHRIVVCDISETNGLDYIDKQCKTYSQQGIDIDGIINNAGCNQFALLSERNTKSIIDELNINLTSPIILSKLALGWLNRPGFILNIGSTFGSIGYPGYSSYCAAKSGLHRFSEALQRELKGTGINVFYLAPRATQTTLNNLHVNALNKQLGNQTDTPEIVAKNVLEVLQKEINTRWIGWPEKLFARINQLFPNLVSASIYKQQDTINSFLNSPSTQGEQHEST